LPNECGEQGDYETRIHETGDSDNLGQWISLNGWDGGSVTRDSRPVESEENRMEEGGRFLVRIGLEV